MTSAIVSETIDADFPVAGQDNDSQGFRDNFQIIKDGLAAAGGEITVLQNSTAKLDDDNDFNGNVIDNAQTNRLYGTVYPINTSTATTDISLDNGEYQEVTLVGNHTLTFKDWPEDNLYAKVRLELKGDGLGQWVVTFTTSGGGIIRKEVTQSLAQTTGASRNPSVGSVSSTKLSFPTANITGGTFEEGDAVYGTNLQGTVAISQPIDSIISTATTTTEPTALNYTDIDLNAVITTTDSTANLSIGDKVQLSDVGSMTGISSGTNYYVFDITGGTFTLAATRQDALDSVALTGLGGVAFNGAASAVFPELDITFSNMVTVSSVSGMYVGMPIKFTGTGFGGVSQNVEYYIIRIYGGKIRISATLGGEALPLTSASGTLTVVPTTVFTVSHDSQVVSSASNLTLTTSDSLFPTPFRVSEDTSRFKFVEAWTANGGNTVFLKYLGEYA